MRTETPRETNNPQLRWKCVSDMRKASLCGRYVVDRTPNFDNHPMMGYAYTAKRADGTRISPSHFVSFNLAAAACERDLF